MPKIAITIPAYNEENRIRVMLDHYLLYFGNEVQFVVVANHCSDNTVGVVEGIQRQFPGRVQLINEPAAIGKGGAIVQGWKASTEADIVGFVDADGATSPVEFDKVLKAAQQADGAIASRFMKGATVLDRSSLLRKFVSWAARRCFQILFLLPVNDTQCGAKVFKQSAIQPILADLKTNDMLFDVELLWRLKQRNAHIIEVPTVWADQPGSAMLGSSHKFISKAIQLFFNVLKLRVTLR